MGTVGVLVVLVFGQDMYELTLVADQHPVQPLVADRADPSLGISVGLRRTRRTSNTVMPSAANTGSKEAVNFVSRSRTKYRNGRARSPIAIMKLRAC